MTVKRAPLPSPRWAIELVYGQQLHAAGLLAAPLPCPPRARPPRRACRRRRARNGANHSRAGACRYVPRSRCRAGARQGRSRADRCAPTGTAELLAGFGALRSAQLEVLLGVTRLGVRGMLATLIDSRLVTRGSVAGVWLYSLSRADLALAREAERTASPAFSRETLAEYEAANTDLDRLLARLGIGPDEDDV